jgi:hypothetical protein
MVSKPAVSGCNCSLCISKKAPRPAPPECPCPSCQNKAAASAVPSISPPSIFDDPFIMPPPPSRGASHYLNCSCSMCKPKTPRIPTPQPPLAEDSRHSNYEPGCPCSICTLQRPPPTSPGLAALSSLLTPPAHSTLNPGCTCAFCESPSAPSSFRSPFTSAASSLYGPPAPSDYSSPLYPFMSAPSYAPST